MISESKLLDRQILKNGDKSDQSLLWMLVLLLSFGLLMVYSASIAWAGDDGNPWKIVEKQAQFVALGCTLAFALFWVKMSFWRRASVWLLAGNTLVLLAALVVGEDTNGAKRWINLGFFNYQPSETYKLAVILYLAAFFNRRAEVLKTAQKPDFPRRGGGYRPRPDPARTRFGRNGGYHADRAGNAVSCRPAEKMVFLRRGRRPVRAGAGRAGRALPHGARLRLPRPLRRPAGRGLPAHQLADCQRARPVVRHGAGREPRQTFFSSPNPKRTPTSSSP